MENKIINILLNDAKYEFIGQLNEDYFFSEDAKRQFNFILDYSNQYKALPSLTVMQSEFPNMTFEETTEGEEAYFVEKFIENKQRLNFRNTLEIALRNANAVLTTATITELVDSVVEPLQEFRNTFKVDKNGTNWAQSAKDRMKLYEEKAQNPETEGVKTNIAPIDDCIKGLQQGDLTSIAGYSGTGKTWFMLYLAIQAYMQGKSVLFYSLEMADTTIASRLDTFAFNISNVHLDTGRLDEQYVEKYKDCLVKLSEMSKLMPNFIQIFSSKHIEGGLTVNRISADMKKFNADVVFVDQLSLMKHTFDLRQSYIRTTAELKQLAMNNEISIVLAVQMNRGSVKEKDADITGISESNSIVENSDKVLILKRPPRDDENKSKIKLMNIYVSKARNNAGLEEPITCTWDVNIGKIKALKDSLGDI